MLLAKLMQLLERISEVKFELVFLAMDPGYSGVNRKRIEANAATLNIPLDIFETDIFEAVHGEMSPCYICARMRRGHLYSRARELGCNKIALGHHMDDVIETTVMAMMYGSQLQAMIPKVHSRNFPGMELIRPMYCIAERDIVSWAEYNNLHFIDCACRLTEKNGVPDLSKRQEVKRLLSSLEASDPAIKKRIFRSLHSVCLDTFPAYKTEGREHSFLERYKRVDSELNGDAASDGGECE